jgi:ribosomal protein S25
MVAVSIPNPNTDFSEYAIGFSDRVILGISIVGFTALAYTVRSIFQLHFRSAQEEDGDDDLTEEQRLCRSDVSQLSRAQRRARAKAIMKEQRRLVPGPNATAGDPEENPDNAAAEGEHDIHHVEHVGGGIVRSRKERQQLAKAAEREERRLFQEERERQQRAAQIRAQQQKQERLLSNAQRMEEAQREKELEAEIRRQQEEYEWRTFLKANGSLTDKLVSEFLEDCQDDRVVNVEALASQYGVESSYVVNRIQQLILDGRIAGFFQEDSTRFIYVANDELRAIASKVMDQGYVSLQQFTEICEQSIGM